mmetsp:Transcript_23372/g.73276  ORF Transcript_23372/g.73276 Transcript_23372/m.73276 type:complete len:326 (-) Transcript_23372:205-1182(-)
MRRGSCMESAAPPRVSLVRRASSTHVTIHRASAASLEGREVRGRRELGDPPSFLLDVIVRRLFFGSTSHHYKHAPHTRTVLPHDATQDTTAHHNAIHTRRLLQNAHHPVLHLLGEPGHALLLPVLLLKSRELVEERDIHPLLVSVVLQPLQHLADEPPRAPPLLPQRLEVLLELVAVGLDDLREAVPVPLPHLLELPHLLLLLLHLTLELVDEALHRPPLRLRLLQQPVEEAVLVLELLILLLRHRRGHGFVTRRLDLAYQALQLRDGVLLGAAPLAAPRLRRPPLDAVHRLLHVPQPPPEHIVLNAQRVELVQQVALRHLCPGG